MKIKQADNRKQRSCMSILSETFRDFAENTSIHGLKYTVRSDTNPYEKMFWLLIVLSGVCGAIYMTILFWERYTSNPTRTTILTTFAPTVIIPFPAVTVCNINRIMVDKVDSFVDELHLKGDEAELAKRALPQLLAFTHPTFTKFNVTELQTLQAILENNEITDINYIMKRITQSCPEMLVKCVWSYKEEECMELFRETLTVNGHCCSFNYIEKFESEMVHTPYHGPSSGLYLILDTMTQSVQHTPLYSKGMQVMK
ncbi:unnamed protein product [Brassicogethes aeneus]|uniref:Uncharacterized protein n=1 Tax=Brassicogethes aeneus TaxID=1431903 RepID=A0A9P0AW71_BRAAE|nr:unnamed protein product [Brassicogethes aeneus]